MRRRRPAPYHPDLFGDFLRKIRGAPAETDTPPGAPPMDNVAQQPSPATLIFTDQPAPSPVIIENGEERRASAYISGKIQEATLLPPGRLLTVQTHISPAAAAHILKAHNLGNRRLRHRRIEHFARIIREGRWKVSHQGISFAREGVLNNGQHRLHGIVKAGQTVEVMLFFNESRAVFDIIDTHDIRGGSDALAMAGYQNTAALSASLKLLRDIESGAIHSRVKMENDELVPMAEAHPKIVDAVVMGHALGSKFRCSTAGLTVAIYNIMTKSKHSHRLEEFYSLVHDGGGDCKPIVALRDGLQTKRIYSHTPYEREKMLTQYAAMVETWNRFVKRQIKPATRWVHPTPLPAPL